MMDISFKFAEPGAYWPRAFGLGEAIATLLLRLASRSSSSDGQRRSGWRLGSCACGWWKRFLCFGLLARSRAHGGGIGRRRWMGSFAAAFGGSAGPRGRRKGRYHGRGVPGNWDWAGGWLGWGSGRYHPWRGLPGRFEHLPQRHLRARDALIVVGHPWNIGWGRSECLCRLDGSRRTVRAQPS